MLYMNQMPEDWSDALQRRIGRNIRKKRLQAGWSLNMMFAQTGIQRETIYHWEHADRTPKITQLMWLCKCTGWKLSEILGGAKDG